MSNEAVQIDPAFIAELDSALDLLDAHFARIPQPGLWLLMSIDMLQRVRRLIPKTEAPIPERYAIIAARIAGFFSRRPDGTPALILPEDLECKLRALMEKAQSLSAERNDQRPGEENA